MNYIKNTSLGTLFHENKKESYHKKSIKAVLNDLLLPALTTYEGRIEATKRYFSMSHNVPLFINDSVCLFQSHHLKAYDNVAINALNVIRVEAVNLQTKIYFKDGTTLFINKPYLKLLKKYQKTLDFMNRLKKEDIFINSVI